MTAIHRTHFRGCQMTDVKHAILLRVKFMHVCLWLRSTWRYECFEAFEWPIKRILKLTNQKMLRSIRNAK